MAELHRDRFLIDPVNIIPPVFHSHLLHVGLTRRTNERRLITAAKQCCFRNRGALGCRVPFYMWAGGEGCVMAEAISLRICMICGLRCRIWASLREISVGQSNTVTDFCSSTSVSFHHCYTLSTSYRLCLQQHLPTKLIFTGKRESKKKKKRFLP